MNKRGLVIAAFAVVLLLSFCGFALAANETESTDNIDQAYNCLDSQIKNKNLSLKEATFGVLALGAKGNLVDRMESEKDSNSCWPKGACKLKETAQVALAYNRIGKETSAIKKWIFSKNVSAGELKWLIEIDITSRLAASCTINDGQKANTIKILDNSKLQGSPGSCLSIDPSGFMLKVNSNCLGKEFEISCDQDFISSVLYQKTSGGTLFVLPEAHSAASLGKTKEKINGQCFGTDKTCDYEGTLWTALALQKMGEDISKFTPYLLALADDNTRYFPSAFLYVLAGGEDQYNLIIQQQKQGKFWEMTGTRDGRYYDTSLALLGLSETGTTEIEATKSYLLSIQTKDGCYIRDTAFLLYSGWPRGVVSYGKVSNPASCEPQFSCENAFACSQAGGTIEYDYECPNVGKSCCSIKLQEQSCEEKKGLLCPSGTQCGGRVESSSDGACCFDGGCIEVQQTGEDECTLAGGICRAECDSGEGESTDACTLTGDRCCVASGGSSLWFWIIFLLLLIALVVLGIIFKEKVKIWWYKTSEWVKVKFGKKPAAQAGGPRTPGAPFAPSASPMMQQRPPMMPQQRPQVIQPPRNLPVRPLAKDKEMEEALRKLREMSKK
jgi:hypothetical protein